MKRDIVTSIIGIIVFAILLGLVYPLAITGISQVAFPGNANGQQIHLDGKLVGSKIIGQNFGTPVLEKNGKPKEVKGAVVTEPDPRYFQSASLGNRRRRLQRGRQHLLQPRAQQHARPRKRTQKTSRPTSN